MGLTSNKKSKIQLAIDEVHHLVMEGQVESDIEYFKIHKDRYSRLVAAVCERASLGDVVLDIGSLYLHASIILKKLGFEVVSMDIDDFWTLDFVNSRKDLFSLEKIVENDLEKMNSHSAIRERYDVVLFAEILEHITFNPIQMWKSIYQITKSGGFIYISTPNSFSLINGLRTLKSLISLRRVGINVDDILHTPTYGHHWKEFSAKEIKEYFKTMSDDFDVEISRYHYKSVQKSILPKFLVSALTYLGNQSGVFAEELEAFIHLNKTGSWKISDPKH